MDFKKSLYLSIEVDIGILPLPQSFLNHKS